IAWLVRIFKDSRSNLCTKASFNPDLPGPIFISLWLGALLGEATPANVAGRSVEVHTDYAVVEIPPAPSPPPDSAPAARDGLSMAQVSPNGNIPQLFVYHQPNLATWVVVLDGS